MKKFFFVSLILIGINVQSQITYEHTYTSAATYNFCAGSISQLLVVDFEESGERIIRINRCGETLDLYNLNHSLVQSISLASLPQPDGLLGYFMYISENLFDLDSDMEFMYITTSPDFHTYVYDEDLTLLFSEPGAPIVYATTPAQQLPIYNTSEGTKLILSYTNGDAKVFGLGGTLMSAIEESTAEMHSSNVMLSNPYPNPTSGQTQINYVLPNSFQEGVIVVYDLQGQELKRYTVNSSSNMLVISNDDFSSGTYYYQLQVGGQNSDAKKMVVAH